MDQVENGVKFHCFHCGKDEFSLYYDKTHLVPVCNGCDSWFFAVLVGEDFLQVTEEGYLERELKALEGKDE